MLRDRVVNLSTPEEVKAFLTSHPTSVIFKAGTCHRTMQGFGFLQEKLEAREDLMVGIIRVIEWRAASNLVAELTGIRHESPQAILFRDGEAVFDVDNWNITPEVLSAGFDLVPSQRRGGRRQRCESERPLPLLAGARAVPDRYHELPPVRVCATPRCSATMPACGVARRSRSSTRSSGMSTST